jgi:hypothetical protein
VIPWAEFQKAMAAFALTDTLDWCRTCETKTFFCTAFEDISSGDGEDGDGEDDGLVSGTGGGGVKGVSPTIGGVIGATVAVAAFIFLAAGLLLAGFRLEKRKKNGNTVFPDLGDIKVLKRSGSGNDNGGFKGADRLGSDADLAFTAGKGGAGATVVRHERVGSWELGDSPSGDSKHASLDKEIESGRVVSGVDYSRRSRELERENPFVDPVKAVDQV